jgi:hypothetical protein
MPQAGRLGTFHLWRIDAGLLEHLHGDGILRDSQVDD